MVINDPQVLQDYRNKIRQRIQDLGEQLKSTENAIQTVGETWQDQNFQQFRDNFNVDKEKIKPLRDILTEYDDVILNNLQMKLEEYVGLNMAL